jgi:DNA-directed RNA polymerase specialized sigma54-like protein
MVKRTLLPDHLMWQLRLSDMSEDDKEIAVLIVGSLDQDGYLTLSTDEVAFLANVWPDTGARRPRARARAAARSAGRRPRATCPSAC